MWVRSYTTQLKKVCSLTHSVLFLKCDLIQNKFKVEQIIHSWELYTVYNFSVCVCKFFLFFFVMQQVAHLANIGANKTVNPEMLSE